MKQGPSVAPDSRPRSGSSVIHPQLWTFYFRCVSSGFKHDSALMNTQRNNAPPLCAPLCPHPLALFTALSARHQVISSFAIAMATTVLRLPRCHPLCFRAERASKRDVVERRIKAARSLRRQARMKPATSFFLLQTVVVPLGVRWV